MFLSEESRQSARVMGHVLNFPLYDGNCSPAARAMLANGDVDGAIAEWRRLADLGSGRARCVLAFVALNGTPSAEPDLEEARRLASSALGGERGYANYVLGCIAIKERQSTDVGRYLGESYKAGFLPAAVLLATLTLASKSSTEKSSALAVGALHRAASVGNRPATIVLYAHYLRGRFGVTKRALGLVLLPIALIRFSLSAKYHCFSVACFHYSIRARVPLFADKSRLLEAKELARPPKYRNTLRFTHIAAATAVAVVAIYQSGDHSYTRIAEWLAIAAWPYAVSYNIASKTVGRGLTALAVQTLLLVLVTAFACEAYLGRTFGARQNMWTAAGVGGLETMALMLASGFGILAAKRVVRTSEPVPHRQLILSTHIVLGLLATLAVFVKPTIWRAEYLARNGLDLVTQSLMAALPYVAVAFFALPLVTTNHWKPKLYLGILAIGTALAVTSNGGLVDVPQGVVLIAQFIGFILAAEWALDGNEW
jgi:hypothetical protein